MLDLKNIRIVYPYIIIHVHVLEKSY